MAAPKVYGFDTGFVCYHRGWHELRRDDLGPLWEHLVLERAPRPPGARAIHYWRSKRGDEVDFVLAQRGGPPAAIECKWSANEFDAAGMRAFRSRYPKGPNLVVAADVDAPYTRRYGGLAVRFVPLAGLIRELARRRDPTPARGRDAAPRRFPPLG